MWRFARSSSSRWAPLARIFFGMTDGVQDRDIRDKCRHSLRIKEGANRIFSLSRNLFQKLDAAKAVLVSNKLIEHATLHCADLELRFLYPLMSLTMTLVTLSGVAMLDQFPGDR